MTPCCRDDCCLATAPAPLTTTEKPHAHVHLFSDHHHDITAVELASVWVGTLLLVFLVLLLVKNIYRTIKTPTLLKRLKSYAEGPFPSTEKTEDGTIGT